MAPKPMMVAREAGGYAPTVPTYVVRQAEAGAGSVVEQRLKMQFETRPLEELIGHTEHTLVVTPLRVHAINGGMRVVNEPLRKLREVRRVAWTTDAEGKRTTLDVDEERAPLLAMMESLLPDETLTAMKEGPFHEQSIVDIGTDARPMVVTRVIDRTLTLGAERSVGGRLERAFKVDVVLHVVGPPRRYRRLAMVVRGASEGWFVPETGTVESLVSRVRVMDEKTVREQLTVRERCRSNCP